MCIGRTWCGCREVCLRRLRRERRCDDWGRFCDVAVCDELEPGGILRSAKKRLWKLFVFAVDTNDGTNGYIVVAGDVNTSNCGGSWRKLMLKSHGRGCFLSKQRR